MERLYAVPSEKLRVWSVWLSGVGEIADEWHKWLQAHIDLIARIEESLQMAAHDVPGGRKIESAVSSDESSRSYRYRERQKGRMRVRERGGRWREISNTDVDTCTPRIYHSG